MIYTKKTPWTLVLGIIMVAYAYMVQAGMMEPVIKYLHTSKLTGEMVTMGYIAGIITLVVGLWQAFGTSKPGNFDYYMSTIGGLAFILIVTFIVKWGLDPQMGAWGKAAAHALGFNFAKVMNLNYVVMGIVAGIVIVNVFKIPDWAQNGVRMSRLALKTGVIMLGVLYSWEELKALAGLSIVLIGFFVLGSVGLTLWMGARRNIPNSMAGALSAGLGVCGVSATVAAAPVVNAKGTEIAYTIGTILLWGVMCMFLFPIAGKAMDMNYTQFGAWAGTGILNSAQVAGAALAFQPTGIETLKVAEIFNITRILFLPIIVLWLAVWFVKREQTGERVNLGQVVFAKFPLFVIGFILMFVLGSTGVFAPAQHYKGKFFDNSEKALVKTDKATGKVTDKRLKDADAEKLKAEADKLLREDHKAALARLIAEKKIMAPDHDILIRGIINGKILSKDATEILKKQHGAVYHTAGKIKMFRNLIAWFFAFGLTGLGMQITMASIKQAGGQPLVIGSVVGTVKALGSLVVVLLFVTEIV
ncbi:MAG: hypothetical protein A2V91_02040 [Candidatus Muproteobacteria bacterium RBG_16_64_10]|uniref:Sulfate exporter family transporter n=1 Tax=Candidatus Muproteobacteria bacterium RBG_16_64_10 TaxID=1817757 RepID=A0A1F6SVZ1_9PROT|nr:MAG: hypothetical protein A2V91_02040 [Candidatus Muproteobacteria bacterium RBG_16_64_10]